MKRTWYLVANGVNVAGEATANMIDGWEKDRSALSSYMLVAADWLKKKGTKP